MLLNVKTHTILSIATLLATLVILAKVVLGTHQQDAQVYQLPAQPSLPSAKLESSEALPEIASSYYSQSLAGRRYIYQFQSLPLTTEVHYITGTAGDLSTFAQGYPTLMTNLAREATTQKQGSSGFYSLYQTQNRAYLTACIAPQGGSTVTRNQFVGGWNNHLYMLGREGYLDDRCLWTTLSVPLNNATTEVAFQALETAWPSWYEWWKAKFPPLGTT